MLVTNRRNIGAITIICSPPASLKTAAYGGPLRGFGP